MPRRNPARLEPRRLVNAEPDAWCPPPPNLTQQHATTERLAIRRLRVCVWPLCTRQPDRQAGIPLCDVHADHIWRHHLDTRGLPAVTNANREAIHAIETQQVDDAKQAAIEAANGDGQIYYIRLNGVIKIGWTSQLHVRLNDYTVGAELLAHHPGSRADERDLHRTFAPVRIHGREWYDGDARILHDHIAAVLAEHGPPQFQATRTTPRRNEPTRMRARNGRR